VVVNAVLAGKGNYGFNAANDTYGDMIEMGILDPTKVTRTALQNAASVAGLMLTTECMVAEAPKDERIPVDAIAGTSMGAIVGGLYASGMNAAELETAVRKHRLGRQVFARRVDRQHLSQRRKEEDFEISAADRAGPARRRTAPPVGAASSSRGLETLLRR
jgi:hypothetical protein